MPSPFPGMDPYVELMGDWVGFHNAFIVYCSDLLNEVLPEQYVSTIEARIRFEPQDDIDVAVARARRPDVAVSHRGNPGTPSGSSGTPLAAVEPVSLAQEEPWADEVRESFIEIVRVPGEQLVTVIELLSPSNKKVGADRAAYLLKRRQLLHEGINLVEIDLLLGGERLPMLEPLPRGDYFAFVSRAIERRRCDVYAWSVRQPLPAIPVPLLPEDQPVQLDLARIFATNYERGRYGRLIRYSQALDLPLEEADRRWATELAATAGRR
jgi:hypothetical protein